MARPEQLAESLRASGKRLTRQRQLVMQILQDNPGHLEADAVHKLAQARDPHIGLATVYRTLAMLKDMGLVQDHTLGEDHAHFEAVQRDAPHHHFTCLTCGRVIEFDAPQVMQAVRALSKKEQVRITDVHLHLKGYCPRCRAGKD